MSEEQTERLEGGTPFETRVLRELAGINRELTSINQRLSGVENRLPVVEEKVEARMRETQPIWEAVLARLDSMVIRLAKMDAKFDVVGSQLLDMRGDIEMLKKHPPAA